ncbi:MAG: PEGA domain-containing protein [Lachnospiraceae bacterium]|nr:PEGA domain-containing protein [Lachnospiraceae bacterium]
MKNTEKVIIPVIIIVIITMLGIYYISKEYEKQQAEKRAEQISETVDGEQEDLVDSEDLVYESVAVLVGKDEEEKKLKFVSVDNEKMFELEYTGKTQILARHGNSLTLDEIPLGEILDITYSIHSKELIELRISKEAWTFTDVTKFEIDEASHRMDIAGSTYRLADSAIVSYRDELASFMDVTNVDTLIVKGYARKVFSIIVDKGHGYVRLMNDTYFEGGWIEIGQEVIKKITEEMLIPVPEGSYKVRFTNKGYAAEEDIVVERDRETVIDLSKADIKEVAIGHVEFTIDPDYAQLYIDGEITDYVERVPLEYGIHKIHVELAGYKNVDTNIRVSDEFADVAISLEKDGADSTTTSSSTTTAKKTTSSSSTSSSSTSYLSTSSTGTSTTSTVLGPLTQAVPTPWPVGTSSSSSSTGLTSSSTSSTGESSGITAVVSDKQKMYIESPEEAEIYIDGIYVGISPALVPKPGAGTHVITLSRNGYITKSYTISVADDDNDVTLSFSELIEE